MYERNRYTRVVVIPGKTYTCGCDVQRYTALHPEPHKVDKATCPTHGQPVAPESKLIDHVPAEFDRMPPRNLE